jgi:hypothetical protein
MRTPSSTKTREPWLRFESRVDPDNALAPAERQRRAKISYRASLRLAAARGAHTRAVKKQRREAASGRAIERPISAKELEDMKRERREYVRVVTILLAAERGYSGVLKLMKNQSRQRADCWLCGRPFEHVTDRSL